MSQSQVEFAELIRAFRAGSDDAFQQIVDNYGHHIYRAVRRKMNIRLRSKFDSADFVQALWASLVEQRDDLREFATADELIAFLTGMANNKVVDEFRRRTQSKNRNVYREVSIDNAEPVAAPTWKYPTPSTVAMTKEQEERLVSGQGATHLRILEMKRHGATHAEIARNLNVAEKTVQRVLNRMARRIAQ